MRQKDDVSVAELLSQLREGTHTENDIEKKSAYNTTWWPKLSASNNHFFVATNDLLNSHNNAVFHSSPTVKAQVKCIDLIAGDISDDLKKKITQKSLMIQQKWALAVGEKYDLTTNVKVMVWLMMLSVKLKSW